MIDVEYMGYNFNQNAGSDRYRIYNSDGQIVEHGYKKPDMTMSDAVRTIERYILISETVKAVMG